MHFRVVLAIKNRSDSPQPLEIVQNTSVSGILKLGRRIYMHFRVVLAIKNRDRLANFYYWRVIGPFMH